MPPASLLLASQNAGKLNEMKQLVAGRRFEDLSPRDLGIIVSI
jgi:inosine/xanthosine triphosphate pyrophosphatase family protein